MTTKLSGNLTWLGHSTFVLDTPGGRRIMFEAFTAGCPTCPPAWHRPDNVDAILLTHGHADHIGDVADIATASNARVGCIVELGEWLAASGGVSEDQIVTFNKGGTIEIAGLRVTMVHAQHTSSTPDGTYAGEPAGFVVELEDGYRIYHAGDTNVFGDMALIRELYRPDLALLPIGGYYTMDPREAATAVDLLGVREVAGMHYGTFPPLTGTPSELRSLVPAGVTVHELQPGGVLGGAANHQAAEPVQRS